MVTHLEERDTASLVKVLSGYICCIMMYLESAVMRDQMDRNNMPGTWNLMALLDHDNVPRS